MKKKKRKIPRMAVANPSSQSTRNAVSSCWRTATTGPTWTDFSVAVSAPHTTQYPSTPTSNNPGQPRTIPDNPGQPRTTPDKSRTNPEQILGIFTTARRKIQSSLINSSSNVIAAEITQLPRGGEMERRWAVKRQSRLEAKGLWPALISQSINQPKDSRWKSTLDWLIEGFLSQPTDAAVLFPDKKKGNVSVGIYERSSGGCGGRWVRTSSRRTFSGECCCGRRILTTPWCRMKWRWRSFERWWWRSLVGGFRGGSTGSGIGSFGRCRHFSRSGRVRISRRTFRLQREWTLLIKSILHIFISFCEIFLFFFPFKRKVLENKLSFGDGLYASVPVLFTQRWTVNGGGYSGALIGWIEAVADSLNFVVRRG